MERQIQPTGLRGGGRRAGLPPARKRALLPGRRRSRRSSFPRDSPAPPEDPEQQQASDHKVQRNTKQAQRPGKPSSGARTRPSGCSTRPFCPNFHDTTLQHLPSPKRYGTRYEGEDPVQISEKAVWQKFAELFMDELQAV